ncbi:hypothetical protein ACP26L_35940 (plasmid) [Paenibacillus sp. S-38]|uniref:hypothetical protein n=1 Tax=Paenibacillus sp. S-38 TaxID=3416710 RepID=UPI003CF1AE33
MKQTIDNETTIDSHAIKFRWDDGEDRGIDAVDRKLISRLLKMGLYEEELNQYDPKTEGAATGWWEFVD